MAYDFTENPPELFNQLSGLAIHQSDQTILTLFLLSLGWN
jgi:hypothetical protein